MQAKLVKIFDVFSLLFGQFIKKSFSVLSDELELLMRLSEEEFSLRLKLPHVSRTGLFSFALNILNFIRGFDDAIIHDLAVGIAAFNRCPADLPTGSELYPEQIQAAMVLTQTAVLQMDTGEGKTYALLPAAFALSRKYGRVYVVCANSYLAFRDASRTKKYWDYVGLSINYCGKAIPHDDSKWQADVIYTTLDVLAFKSLKDDLNKSNYTSKIRHDVLIIDEIDAVLLGSNQSYSIVQSVNSSIYDWNKALKYVENILVAEHISIDWSDNTAQLTVEGIRCLHDFFIDEHLSQNELARMRKAVETAYVAINMQENHEYVIKNGSIVAVNQLTGELEYGIKHDWMIPLSLLIGTRTPDTTIVLHEITTRVLVNQFRHLTGMSGTAQEDIAEYYFSYNLPVTKILPRKARAKNESDKDAVYKTKNSAILEICRQAVNAIERRRPVLIGTQSIKDAIVVHRTLLQSLEENSICIGDLQINLITGTDLSYAASIYENGGQCGSVIIATQIAGRGVDIRLSDEAKANGGIALLGLERAFESRQDKQFLGRVGRQGDPYSAKFFLSLEGDLLKKFCSEHLQPLLNTLVDEVEVIENSLLTSAISSAQKRYRENSFNNRIVYDLINRSENEIWLNYRKLLISLNNAQTESDELLESYLTELSSYFIDSNLKNLIKDYMHSKQSEALISEFIRILPVFEKSDIPPASLEGKKADAVCDKLNKVIVSMIKKKNEEAEEIFGHYRFVRDIIDAYYITSRRIDENVYESTNTEEESESNLLFSELFFPVNEYFRNDSSTNNNENITSSILSFVDFFQKNYSIISWNFYSDGILLFKEIMRDIYPIYVETKQIIKRSQYNVAYWSIVGSFIKYVEQKSKLRQQLFAKELPTIEFQRLFSKGIEDSWQTIIRRVIYEYNYKLIKWSKKS